MGRSTKFFLLLLGTLLFPFLLGLPQEPDIDVARKAYEDGFYDVAEGILRKYISSGRFLHLDEAKVLLARVYLREGKVKESLKILLEMRGLPDLDPKLRLEIYETLVEVYQKLKDRESSLQICKEMLSSEIPEIRVKGVDLIFQVLSSEKKFSDVVRILSAYASDPSREVRKVVQFKIAQAYYEMGEYAKAKDLFEKYIYDYPESEFLSSAYFFLGKIHYALGNYDEAIKFFDKVALIYEDQEWGGYALQGKAWALLRKGKIKEARKVLQQAKKILPHSTDAIDFAEGYLALKEKRYREAISIFESVLAKYPDTQWRPDIYYWMAEAFFNLKDYEKARFYYKQAITLLSTRNGKDARDLLINAYYGLAWANLRLGRLEEAIETFKQIANESDDLYAKVGSLVKIGDILMMEGKYSSAIEVFNDILTKYPDTYYSDYILLQIGIAYIKMKKFDQAILYFEEILKEYPKSNYRTDVLYNLAIAYFNLGDFKSTIELLEKVKKEGSGEKYQPHLDYILATAYFNLQDFKSALHLFRKVLSRLEKEDLRPEVEYELAWCYYRLGRESEAMKRFRHLIDKYPEDVLAREVLLWLAEKYLSEDKFTQSQAYLEEFIRRYPDSPEVYKARYDLAWLYAMKGEEKKSLELFSKYAEDESNPMRAEYYIAQAYLLAEQGKYAEAIEKLKLVLERYPEYSAKVYKELSSVYYSMGRLADSAYALEKLVEILPEEDRSKWLFRIGTIWEEAGEMDKAVEFYLKVGYNANADPRLRSQALLKAARIYERKGKIKEAVKLYERVERLGGPEVKLAQEKLKEYEGVLRK